MSKRSLNIHFFQNGNSCQHAYMCLSLRNVHSSVSTDRWIFCIRHHSVIQCPMIFKVLSNSSQSQIPWLYGLKSPFQLKSFYGSIVLWLCDPMNLWFCDSRTLWLYESMIHGGWDDEWPCLAGDTGRTMHWCLLFTHLGAWEQVSIQRGRVRKNTHGRLSFPLSLIELINLVKIQCSVICLAPWATLLQQQALLATSRALTGAVHPWASAKPHWASWHPQDPPGHNVATNLKNHH